MFNIFMEKCTYRTLKGQNLPGTLPPELNKLRYLQIMYVVLEPILKFKLTVTEHVLVFQSHA